MPVTTYPQYSRTVHDNITQTNTKPSQLASRSTATPSFHVLSACCVVERPPRNACLKGSCCMTFLSRGPCLYLHLIGVRAQLHSWHCTCVYIYRLILLLSLHSAWTLATWRSKTRKAYRTQLSAYPAVNTFKVMRDSSVTVSHG